MGDVGPEISSKAVELWRERARLGRYVIVLFYKYVTVITSTRTYVFS